MIKKKWFRITRIVASAFLIAALVFAFSPRGMSIEPSGRVSIVNNVVYAHPAAPTGLSIQVNNNDHQLNGDNNSEADMAGLIDEVRVSSTARSANWIKPSYNNQYSPSSFCSVGAEE